MEAASTEEPTVPEVAQEPKKSAGPPPVPEGRHAPAEVPTQKEESAVVTPDSNAAEAGQGSPQDVKKQGTDAETPPLNRAYSADGTTIPTVVALEDGSLPKPYYFDEKGFLRHYQTDLMVDMDSAIKGDLGTGVS